MINSRHATAADFDAFYGKQPPRSVRGRVLERDGKPVGLAGYYVQGGMAVMFSDMKDAIPAITIWRESLAMMQSLKIPAICVGSDKSAGFLERLGWVYQGPSDDGDVYHWIPKAAP